MYIGIPSGYIRFGTLAHKILLFIHENGRSTQSMLVEELGKENTSHISLALKKMADYGFVYRWGKWRARPGDNRMQSWNICPPQMEIRDTPKLTSKERGARYHKKRKMKVASVFNFRGKVSL